MLRLSIASSLALLVLACSDSTAVDAPAPTGPFVILPLGSQTLQVPRSFQLLARGGTDTGAISWQSSDEGIASVSESGIVTARYPGSVTITARRGLGVATMDLSATAGRLDIEPSIVTMDPNAAKLLTATVRDADGAVLSAVPVRWSTNNASVAAVNATTGVVTAIAGGFASITAAGGGASGVATIHVNLTLASPLVLSSIGSIGNHACALEAPSGLAYCWGDNHAGALGIGNRDGSDFPTRVLGGQRFSSLSVGDYATCGVEAETGSVYCWGANRFGDLGDGTLQTRWEPTQVASSIRFSGVSASGNVTCGIDAQTGLGYCWGRGGLIGDGTVTQRSTPTLVANGALRFSTISASGDHACGLEAESGIAYCWGRNVAGQLGDATTLDRLAPALVSGTLRFSSITVGSVSCGIEAETGFAYCWGRNKYGQVGDGTRTDRPVPTLVGGGRTRFRSISATGSASVCAIEAQTDLVYCWGTNTGSVQNGTTDRLEPTLVGGGGTRFDSISAAYIGFCGVESETGFGYCWTYRDAAATRIPGPQAASLSAPLMK